MFAPVAFTASATVLKIGQPSCVVPPLPGVTPPTTVVPYACACFAWKVPSLPVRPWTISRVDLSRRMAIVSRSVESSVDQSSRVVESVSRACRSTTGLIDWTIDDAIAFDERHHLLRAPHPSSSPS